jgi:ketosteroid isomerase-like protein
MIRQLGLGLTLGCWATTETAQAQAAPASRDTEVAQQVMDLEQVWSEAENRHDAATLRSILDDKFVFTMGGDGKLYDKDAFITGNVRGAPDPTRSQTLTDRTVIVNGDTAVSMGTDTERGTHSGKPFKEVARYTVTYVRRGERWIPIAEHMDDVPLPK